MRLILHRPKVYSRCAFLFDVFPDIVAEVKRIARDKPENDEQQRDTNTRKNCEWRFPEIGKEDNYKHADDETIKRQLDAMRNVTPRLLEGERFLHPFFLDRAAALELTLFDQWVAVGELSLAKSFQFFGF
jgi:hypothetical protein